jgi:hypothetical protein
VKQKSLRRVLGRIAIFLIGLGFFAAGLGPLIRAKTSPGNISGLSFAPIGIMVGILAMIAAIFTKDRPVEDMRSPRGRKKRRR